MSTSRPRLLHVAHNCAPHIGGLETVVAAETTRLAARGWRVTLVSSASAGVPAGSRVEDGVRVVRLRAWSGLEARFGVPFPFFTPWLLVVLLREVRRADLVHIHDPLYLTSWVAAVWCRLLGRPYVVHRHVGFVHHPALVVRLVQWTVLQTVGRLVFGGAAALLPIDDFIAAQSEGRSTGPVRVLGNGVDTERYRPPAAGERQRLRTELGLPLDLPLLLFVGRFVPKKGFPLVAAAAGDDYRIVFAGGERPEGADDARLLFLGSMAPEQLARVYRCVDAFVCASVGECPLTVLEAMSSGLPVLVNDDPALHSPWTAGPGVRFVDMAEGDLPHAVADLLGDLPAARRLGEQSLGVVRREFSWEAHTDRLETVYDEALDDEALHDEALGR